MSFQPSRWPTHKLTSEWWETAGTALREMLTSPCPWFPLCEVQKPSPTSIWTLGTTSRKQMKWQLFLEEIKCFCLFKQTHRDTPTYGCWWPSGSECGLLPWYVFHLPPFLQLSHTPNHINAVVCNDTLIKLFKKKRQSSKSVQWANTQATKSDGLSSVPKPTR